MNENSNTVLLIEDNPGDARLIRELLRRGDLVTIRDWRTPTELETGLERLAEGGIDVALLDLSLPDSRGNRDVQPGARPFARRCRSSCSPGSRTKSVAAQTLRAGGQDFLNKGALEFVLHQSSRSGMPWTRKQAEEHRMTPSTLVEAANRVHDEFLAVLSDELRTPLTSMLSSRLGPDG